MIKIYKEELRKIESLLRKKKLNERELIKLNQMTINLENNIKRTLKDYLTSIERNFNTELSIDDILKDIKELEKIAKKLDNLINKYC